jgi:hypothetical protein
VLAGEARRADLVIPSPAFMETFDDAPTPVDSPVATFSIATPIQAAPAGTIEPDRLIQRLAAALLVPVTASGEGYTLAECLKRRVDVIHKSGRGSVFNAQDGTMTGLAGIDSPEKLWKILSEGGCWVDSMAEARALPRFTLLGAGKDSRAELARAAEGRLQAAAQAPGQVVIMPHGVRGALDDTTVSPLMTKLYQESGLRRLLNQADINPVTAKALGLAEREGAVLETATGSIRVEIRFDPGVMPGVIRVAVGPVGPRQGNKGLRDTQSILTICQTDSGPVWRVTRAKVREA